MKNKILVKMKMKLMFVSILMFCFSLLFAVSMQAQGIFNNNSGSNESAPSIPGLRGGPPSGGNTPDGPGGDGDQKGEPGDDSDPKAPVGEGLLILTAFSGGYAFLKKQNKKRGI
jgi:hypothetical protein